MFARSLRCFVAALLLGPLALAGAGATMVRLSTPLGPIDIELMDAQAPITVANFLTYVRNGAYDSSFVHRSVPGFVIQGGGFAWLPAATGPSAIATAPPIVNEFSSTRPNLRGTVAMAKTSAPNSATSQWFVNLADNTFLDTSAGGLFTVFGRVTPRGLAVADAIAKLPITNAGSPYNELPYFDTGVNVLQRNNVVLVTRATVLTDSDRVFNYLESIYPTYAQPAGGAGGTELGYYYRHFAASGVYVGTANGKVYYLVPELGGRIEELGSLADWLQIAAAAGF